MAGGHERGGILALLDLIEEHRPALRYDWRTRFHLSLDNLPHDVGWDEAIDLVRVLRLDPSSQIAAAVEGWKHPLAREGWMLADLIDVQGFKWQGKKWKPYMRPIQEATTKHIGDVSGRTRAEVLALLGRPAEVA